MEPDEGMVPESVPDDRSYEDGVAIREQLALDIVVQPRVDGCQECLAFTGRPGLCQARRPRTSLAVRANLCLATPGSRYESEPVTRS